jgi:hypothetical protein
MAALIYAVQRGLATEIKKNTNSRHVKLYTAERVGDPKGYTLCHDIVALRVKKTPLSSAIIFQFGLSQAVR